MFKLSEQGRSRILHHDPGTSKFKCDECGMEPNQEAVMVSHLHLHSGDTLYYCIHCSVQTMTQGEIMTHVHGVHKQIGKGVL